MKKYGIGKYIILIVVIVIYLVISLFLYLFQKREGNKYLYLLIDSNVRWSYVNGEWKSITDNNLFTSKFYDVYSGGEKIGNYNVIYSDKWYYRDELNKAVNINKDHLFMINANIDVKIYTPKVEVLNNADITIKQMLSTENINANYDDYFIEKALIDLDNDGKNEEIYTASNLNYDFYDKIDSSGNSAYVNTDNIEYFSIAFVLKDGKYRLLSKKVASLEEKYKICTPSVHAVFDYDNDDNSEIILSCQYYDLIGTDYFLYKLAGKEYKIIKSN